MLNLDHIAAKVAQEMVKKAGTPKELDILVTKTLGVLQENGIYACVLFLDSRGDREKEMAKQIREQLEQALKEAGLYQPKPNNNLREWITDNLASQLDQLLLVKQLWEQTLIYARYGAKAAASAESSK
ncbi:MAG: type III-B CRISPR module-associated protein Cmr5 [Anaerolineales bacterium]